MKKLKPNSITFQEKEKDKTKLKAIFPRREKLQIFYPILKEKYNYSREKKMSNLNI